MVEGRRIFWDLQTIIDLPSASTRVKLITDEFDYYLNKFDQEHAFDTYVFCLSEHNASNTDGLLSMWRAYGGHGSGAALVSNTGSLTRMLEIIGKSEFRDKVSTSTIPLRPT